MESSNLTLVMEARDAARSGRGARLRAAAGFSQGEIAAAIDRSVACVSRWEAGERRPRGAAAIAYALVLREIAAALTDPSTSEARAAIPGSAKTREDTAHVAS